MIERYQTVEMAAIWSDEAKIDSWIEVEKAVCRAWQKRGEIPASALADIEEKSACSIERMLEIEAEVHHDVIAFLTATAENIGHSSRYVHRGMTSSDLLDTAGGIRLTKAVDVIAKALDELCEAVGQLAKSEQKSVMMGRTHGMFAEPTTFGLKVASWFTELTRGQKRLKAAKESVAYGKLSGAVGTAAHIAPEMEEEVLSQLGLKAEPVASQIVHRDRHAELLTTLALLGCTLERMALEVRLLQRSEVGEVFEPFGKQQKGSSAMPHKRNPILCERICGVARILRANSIAAMENIALWHERDISHSSVERVIVPDSFHILHYGMKIALRIVRGIDVEREVMEERVKKAASKWGSQAVLLALTDRGFSRDEAYRIVQKVTMSAKNTEEAIELLASNEKVAAKISVDDLAACFSVEKHLANIEYLLNRAGIADSQ